MVQNAVITKNKSADTFTTPRINLKTNKNPANLEWNAWDQTASISILHLIRNHQSTTQTLFIFNLMVNQIISKKSQI